MCLGHGLKCLDIILKLFLSLFHKINLVIFADKISGYYVYCLRNSSYSFTSFALKTISCLGHGLKICILFGHNTRFIVRHFFDKMSLVIFATKINRYQVSCEWNSPYSFTPIALKLYRCLGHGLKMCISFAYNPQHMRC